jgi:hypothetical protein
MENASVIMINALAGKNLTVVTKKAKKVNAFVLIMNAA